MITSDFGQTLLATTLPAEAVQIIQNSFKGTGDPFSQWLDNLPDKLDAYTADPVNAVGIRLPTNPFYKNTRAIEFIELLRGFLSEVGSRLDLYRYSPRSLSESPLVEMMAAAAKEQNIDLEYGVCPAVRIESGYAIVAEAQVIKLRCADIFLDVEFSDKHAHIIRAKAICKKTVSNRKLSVFSKMIRILFMLGVPFVSGNPTTKNTGCAFMENGEWRFETEETLFGLTVTKLEKFWLCAGAVPARLTEVGSPYLYFLREDRAFSFIENYRETHPEVTASPFYCASRNSIYDKETLSRLKKS